MVSDDDGCCQAAFIALESLLDVSFVTDADLDMELLIGNVGGTCGADGCMRFELRDTSTDTLVFGTSGYYLGFADGRGVDLFDYDPTVGIPVLLPAGSYSFFARTGAQWHSRERTASGEALAVSLTIVPEPGTATLVAVGLTGPGSSSPAGTVGTDRTLVIGSLWGAGYTETNQNYCRNCPRCPAG